MTHSEPHLENMNVRLDAPCNVCRAADLVIVYKAPLMPLGGQLIDPADEFEPELFYPLHYAICRQCGTLQSVESIPAGLLRSENTYLSVTSKGVIRRDHEIYLELKQHCRVGSGSVIVEVGGSDGVFLQNFIGDGVDLLNIEPVAQTAALAAGKGIETVVDFLNEPLTADVVRRKGKADVIIAKQLLEVVPDLHAFVRCCAEMLADRGRILIEVPYVRDLLEGNFYDVLAHLRKYHFSLTGLVKLFSMSGLAIEEVIHYPELGGGLRFYAGWKDDVTVSPAVECMLAEERNIGLNCSNYHAEKFGRGLSLRRELFEVVSRAREDGKRIAGFGAGIKASAVLNFCGLDSRYIDFLVDNGPHKQGMLMPGVRLPIHARGAIDDRVDYILLLAWLHQEEIVESLKEFLATGGKIIVPAPTVYVLSHRGIA